MFDLKISPKVAGGTLLLLFGALLAINIVVVVLRIEFERDYIYGLAPRFDFDRPIGVPVWFGGVLLLTASLASFICASTPKFDHRERSYWRIIAVFMILQSFNHIASIHTELAAWLSGSRAAESQDWTIIYLLVLVLVSLWLMPFLRRLPRSTAIALAVAGSMAWVACVALPLLGAEIAQSITSAPVDALTREQWVLVKKSWLYVAETTLEKSFEMLGLVLYIVGVLGYLSRRGVELRISFQSRLPAA